MKTLRDGGFNQYFHSLVANMKWVCGLDRNHYESSLPLMLRDLSLLEERHPGLYIEFSENKRFVGQKSQNPFSRLPIDQCNEHEVNWLKNESAVIGNFDDPSTVQRDQVARPEMARIIQAMESDIKNETHGKPRRHHEQVPSQQIRFKVGLLTVIFCILLDMIMKPICY